MYPASLTPYNSKDAPQRSSAPVTQRLWMACILGPVLQKDFNIPQISFPYPASLTLHIITSQADVDGGYQTI